MCVGTNEVYICTMSTQWQKYNENIIIKSLIGKMELCVCGFI